MYDDIQSFLEDLIESKTKARPSSSVRIAKQRIGYGEDPMVAAREFETYALGQGWKPKRVARGVRRIQDTVWPNSCCRRQSPTWYGGVPSGQSCDH